MEAINFSLDNTVAMDNFDKSMQAIDAATWEYNGQSFAVDVCDIEFIEKFSELNQTIIDLPKAIEGIKDGFRTMRIIADLFVNFFDGLFGEGAALKLIDQRLNARKLMLAYKDLISIITDKAANSERIVNAL